MEIQSGRITCRNRALGRLGSRPTCSSKHDTSKHFEIIINTNATKPKAIKEISMATNRAVEILGPREARVVTNRPKPRLRDEYILIKVSAIALNPTDWKHVDFMAPKGALSGCDYAGVVEEVGARVKKPFKKGDRVCGMCHGANMLQLEDGAFAEYIVAKGNIQMMIPPQMRFEEAATLGVGVVTIG